MEIRPGDTVLVPVVDPHSTVELDRLSTALREGFPGVEWRIIDGTPMTHALVYRDAVASKTESQALREIRQAVVGAMDALSDARMAHSGRVQRATGYLSGVVSGIDAVLNGGDQL